MTNNHQEPGRLEVISIGEASVPDLRAGGMARIGRNAETISHILTDSGKLAVVSSGSVESLNTARIFLENPWVSSHSVKRETILGASLAKAILADESGETDNFAAQIEPFASMIAEGSRADEPTGLILVAGSDIVAGLSQKKGIDHEGAVDLRPLGMNHFSIDLPSSK